MRSSRWLPGEAPVALFLFAKHLLAANRVYGGGRADRRRKRNIGERGRDLRALWPWTSDNVVLEELPDGVLRGFARESLEAMLRRGLASDSIGNGAGQVLAPDRPAGTRREVIIKAEVDEEGIAPESLAETSERAVDAASPCLSGRLGAGGLVQRFSGPKFQGR